MSHLPGDMPNFTACEAPIPTSEMAGGIGDATCVNCLSWHCDRGDAEACARLRAVSDQGGGRAVEPWDQYEI